MGEMQQKIIVIKLTRTNARKRANENKIGNVDNIESDHEEINTASTVDGPVRPSTDNPGKDSDRATNILEN